MNKQKWEIIKRLFEQALKIESIAARQQLILERADGDQEVIEQVTEMIAAELSETTLSDVFGKEANNYVGFQWEFKSGELVGAFRIQKKIAEGGMGAVFLGERADDVYTQKVAIKAIRPHILSPETLERFNTERQILANFNHPNIASLIDGGTTSKGIPYYVMEFIDGLPLLEYTQQNSLSLIQKLKIFQKICGAVEYAHQHLVVHRDIKTSNVLITAKGELKLLDFGIAKIMDAEHLDLSITRVDQPILTPENASPEQVKGESVTTATDIYMLGVLLYQLVTNNKPFYFKTNSILEVEKMVCHTAPLKPSQNIDSKDIRFNKIQLSRKLKGDLDNIILKAMAREPIDRYRSAGQLSDDIDRYFYHQPVMAKPGSWLSKAKKFVRRNRIVVTFSTLLATLIIGFSIFVSLQAIQLSQEKDRALLAEKKALQKSQVAGQSSKFMVSLFNASDPRYEGTQFTSAKDLLDNAMRTLTSDEIDDKEVRIVLLFNIGLAYRNLRELENANTVLEEALKLSIEVYGENNLFVAEIKVRLGDSYRTNSQNEQAYVLLKSAIDIQSQFKPQASYEIADSYNNLAWVVYSLGRVDEALRLQKKSVDLHLQYTDDLSPDLSVPFNNLALLYRYTGQYAKGIEYSEKSLKINAGVPGYESNVANNLLNLGRLQRNIGEYQKAIKSLRACRVIRKEIFGENHERTIMIDQAIAITYRIMGEYEKSEELFLLVEQNTLNVEFFNEEDYGIWQSYYSLLLRDQGHYRAAEKRMSNGINIQIKKVGENNPRIFRFQRELAELYILNDKLDQAEALLDKLLAFREEHQSSNNLEIGLLHFSLVKLYHAQGRLEEQQQSANLALSLFQQIDPRALENKQLQILLNNLKSQL